MAFLLLVDIRIEDYGKIVEAARSNVSVIRFDSIEDTYASLLEKIQSSGLTSINIIGIAQHGSTTGESYSLLTKEVSNPLLNIKNTDPELSGWAPYIQFIQQLKNAYGVSIIDLISCQLYNNPDMVYVITTLEQNLGINIRASSNNTGELKSGGDWIQESDGVDIRSVYFTYAIEQYVGLLFITTPPYFVTHPTSIAVPAGSSATFTAIVDNVKSSPSVQCIINGAVYAPTTLVNTSTYKYEITYTFSNVSTNASIYIRAITSAGTATSDTVYLTVQAVVQPLQITMQTYGTVNVREGQTATFTITASGGTAPFTYLWHKMGVAISGATSSSYTTPAVSYYDYEGALYECLVTDGGGNSIWSQGILLSIEKPVSIITQPQEQLITATSSQSFPHISGFATYSVIIDGSGLFTYIWYRGSEVIFTLVDQTSKTSTLQLNDIYLEDNGAQIKVVISNSWSSVESVPISLIVGQPSSATDIIAPTFVNVGGIATFNSTVSGTDFFWYWMKNGVEIPGTFNSFSGTGTTTATYTTPALTSGAVYSIYVSSNFGTATKQTTLTVGDAPVITSITNDVTFVSGNNEQIACTSSGTGVSYQWYKDGVALTGKTGQVLSFNPITTSDVGVYKVSASNNFGTVFSANCTVSVGTAPIIISQSQAGTYTVGVGSYTTFSVSSVSSTTPVSYQWKKNGVDIPNATSNTYTTPIISLSDDNSTFNVVITNEYGSVASNIFRIYAYPAPYIATQPVSQVLFVGSTATFSVNAFSDIPLYYQWKKNGINIPNELGNVYTTPPVSLSDNGDSYSVEVRSAYGSKIMSDPAIITIARAPTIMSQPVSQIGILGSTISTTIDASGTPSLKYSLVRSDNPSAPSTPTTNSTFVIDVSSVQHTYYVIVSNDYGSVQTNTWAVRAGVAPFITSQPQSRTLPIGYNTTLSVDASGDGSLSYQWKKDNIDIVGATNATYSITVSPTLTGTYTVVVSNIYGTTTSTSALLMFTGSTITILSDPPVQQYITDGSSATLSYIVSSTGTLSYKWYKDNVEIPSSNSSSLSTNILSAGANLSSFTRYIYKVDISDDYSHLTPDAVSVYVGYPPTASDISETTYVTIGSSKTLAVELYGSRQMTYVWRRNGVDISGTGGVITDISAANIVVSYTIPSGISYSDNGAVYSLYAVNDYGTLIKQTTLSVGYIPIIIAQPTSKASNINQFISNIIDASGSAPLYYSLVHTDISSSSSIPSTNNTFSIKVENTLHMYYVVVTNNYGSVQTNTWGVGPTLTITSQPQNVAVPIGGTASFSVAATGSGTLTYQWYNGDRQLINGQTDPTFTRNNIGSAASYYAVISDYFGSVTSNTALLTIDYGTVPIITIQPSDCVFAFGDVGGLACEATGAPPFSYQWYKEGVVIPGATGQQLSFSSVTTSDLGKYKVRVTNSYGFIESREATVSTGVPPSFVDASATVYVIRGISKTITVTDFNGTGIDTGYFQWLNNYGDSVIGYPISGPSLTIPELPAVSLYPESTYFDLILTTRFGSASKRINVYFGDVPTFRTQPITEAGFANTQATITLDVLGSYPRTYSFYRSDNPSQPYVTTSPVFSDYYLDSVDRYVVVSNNYGTAQSNIWNFKIGYAPVITSQPQPQSMFVYDGSSILLSVSAIDEVRTPSYYQWKLNGIDIVGATTTTYSVPSITVNHAGGYTVSVINRFGTSVSSTSWVNVLSSPLYTSQPRSININSTKPVTITANVFSDKTDSEYISINAPSVSIDPEAFIGFTDVSSLTITVPNMNSSPLFITSFTHLRTLNMSTISSNIFSAISSFTGLLPQLRSLSLTFAQGADIFHVPTLTNSTSIETVSFDGDRIINMPSGAFSGCTNLKTLTITSKLLSIDYSFLTGCTALTNIILTGNNSTCNSYFDELSALETIKITHFTHLPASNSQKWLFKWCGNLREVEIGPSLTTGFSSSDFINSQNSLEKFIVQFDSTMTEYAPMNQNMLNFSKLEIFDITGKVYIPDTLSYMLNGCSALKNIRINGLYELPISKSNFNQPLLESIDITVGSHYTNSPSTYSIPDFALKGTDSLKSVVLRGRISSIGIGAFYGCTQLTNLDISQLTTSDPNGISIRDFAFALTGISNEVVIPESVGYMGLGLFAGCTDIPKIIYNTPVISYIDHTSISTNMWKYLSFTGPTVIEISGDFIVIAPSENSALTSYELLNTSTQQYTTQTITEGDYKKYVDISKFNNRKLAFETILSNIRIIYNALAAITNPSAAINSAKQRISTSIALITEDAQYACSLPHKQVITNRLSPEFMTDAALVSKNTEATNINNAYQNLININNTLYAEKTVNSATALDTIDLSANIRITLDGKLIDRFDGFSSIDISNGNIWYSVSYLSDGGAKLYLHDGTMISVLAGSIRVNLTTILGADLANIMLDIYEFYMFSDNPTTNYEFNGNVTSISLLSNKGNNTITINSPTTVIFTSAFEDCSQTVFDISAVDLKLYEGSFASCNSCTIRINAVNEIIADKNIFIGTDYCTIDTNKQIINISTTPILLNYGERNFNDISSIIVEAIGPIDFSDIINLEFNLCNSEHANMFAPSIFAISFKQISTLKYYDIILQPSEWFWCYKLDPFLENYFPTPSFESSNGKKYKYLTEADGFVNNFAPDTFTYKNRTFTRTASSKHNGAVAVTSYHSSLQKARDDKAIQFRQNWLPLILTAVSILLALPLAAAPSIASISAAAAYAGGATATILSAVYATTIVVLTIADLSISVFEIVNDIDLAYFDGQGITSRSGITNDISGSSRGLISIFKNFAVAAKNGTRYLGRAARTDNITSVQSSIVSGIRTNSIRTDVAVSARTTSNLTSEVKIKAKDVIKKLRKADIPEFDTLSIDELKALTKLTDAEFTKITKMNPKFTREKIYAYREDRIRKLVHGKIEKAPPRIIGPNGKALQRLEDGTWAEMVQNPVTRLNEIPDNPVLYNVSYTASRRELIVPVQKPPTIITSSRKVGDNITKATAEITSSVTNELTSQAAELTRAFSGKLTSPSGSQKAIPLRVDSPIVKRLSLDAYAPGGGLNKSFAAEHLKLIQRKRMTLPPQPYNRSISYTIDNFINLITEFNTERSNVPNVIDGLNNAELYMESFIKGTAKILKTNTNTLENVAILDRVKSISENFANNADVIFGTYKSVKQNYPEMLTSNLTLNELVSYASLIHKPSIMALNSIGANTTVSDTFDNLCDYSINAETPPYISQVPLGFTNNDAPAYNIYYYLGAKSNKQPESYSLDIEGHANQAFQFASPLMRRSDYLWNGVYASSIRMADDPVTGSINGNPIIVMNEVNGGDQFYLGTRDATYTITTNEKANDALSGAINLIINLREITAIRPYAFASCGTLNGFSNTIPFSILNLKLPNTCVSIGERAFYRSNIATIVIPPSCKTIGKEAFAYCNATQATFTDYDSYLSPQRITIIPKSNTTVKSHDKDITFQDVSEIRIIDNYGVQTIRNNVSYITIGDPKIIKYTDVSRTEFYEGGYTYLGGVYNYETRRPIPYYSTDISSVEFIIDEKTIHKTTTDKNHLVHYQPVLTGLTYPSFIGGLRQVTPNTSDPNAGSIFTETYFTNENGPYTDYTDAKTVWDPVTNEPVVIASHTVIFKRDQKLGDNFPWKNYLTDVHVYLTDKSIITYEKPTIVLISASNRSVSRDLLDVAGTIIGENAFAGNTTLVDVTLPDDVTEIGAGAFSDATNLTTIELPPSLTTIGANAFAGATSLESIIIPPTVETIGSGAFAGATSLTEVVIPSGATIASDAFTGTTSLQTIVFPEGLSTTTDTSFLSALNSSTTVVVPPEYSTQFATILNSVNSSITLQTTTGETVNVPCFPMGTRILTTNGFKEVEKLDSKIDKIITAEGCTVSYKRYYSLVPQTTTTTAPYRIPPHTFGKNKPALPVCLSPLHAIQIKKNLWNIPGILAKQIPAIQQYDVGRAVLYFHIELPDYFRDNIVVEGGLVVESFGGSRIANRDSIYTYDATRNGFTRRKGDALITHVK